MKKPYKKTLCLILLGMLCTMLMLSCSSPAQGEGAQGEEERSGVMDITSEEYSTFQPEQTEEPSPSPEAEPEETPEPTPEQPAAAVTDLPMLNIEGNFMPAKGIEGIDVMNDKVVALTFDDGPHPERTDQLLQILADNDAVATFFVLGENVERYPDVLKRVYEAGHEIGTHSYNHTDLMTLTYDQIITEQYGKTNDVIEQAIGVRALIDRPPYGSMTPEMAEQIGRAQVMWTVDPNEWREEYKNAESLFQNVVKGSEKTGPGVHDGAVVLSHDIHQVTVDAYDRIIKELKNEGYKFVTVTQMMQIAEQRGKTEGFYKFNGAPSAEQAKENQAAGGTGEAPEGAGGGAEDGGEAQAT